MHLLLIQAALPSRPATATGQAPLACCYNTPAGPVSIGAPAESTLRREESVMPASRLGRRNGAPEPQTLHIFPAHLRKTDGAAKAGGKGAMAALAPTFQPFCSSSLAGQKLVSRSSSAARVAAHRQQLIQCRTIEAGAQGGGAAVGPLRPPLAPFNHACAAVCCRRGRLWHKGRDDAGERRLVKRHVRPAACGSF